MNALEGTIQNRLIELNDPKSDNDLRLQLAYKKIKENEEKDIMKTRDWFLKNVKGLGLKESSHFLRNIGFGDKIVILDRHILRSLFNYKVIDEIPKTLTKKIYLEIETKMKNQEQSVSNNEYENEKVPQSALKKWTHFLGM